MVLGYASLLEGDLAQHGVRHQSMLCLTSGLSRQVPNSSRSGAAVCMLCCLTADQWAFCICFNHQVFDSLQHHSLASMQESSEASSVGGRNRAPGATHRSQAPGQAAARHVPALPQLKPISRGELLQYSAALLTQAWECDDDGLVRCLQWHLAYVRM